MYFFQSWQSSTSVLLFDIKMRRGGYITTPSGRDQNCILIHAMRLPRKCTKLIQQWLLLTQKGAEEALLRGTEEKRRGNKEDWTEVPLHEDEIRMLTWMINQNIDFKLENGDICPRKNFKSLKERSQNTE